jgi:hypothetical protein
MVKLKSGIKIRSGIKILVSDNDMILVYEIPSPNTPIELAIQANSTWFSAGQAVVINWGDGSAKETVSDTGGSTYIGHTYTTAGTYVVKVSGTMKAYQRVDYTDNLAGQNLLTHIRSFGKLGIKSFAYAFNYCTRLISVPKYCPKNISNMYHMFYGCSGAAFNPDVSAWDVSNVKNMSYMFRDCSGAAFNPNVSAWNVSKVTEMRAMFLACSGAAFNPNVSAWNVSKVTNMINMFFSCSGAAFRGGRGTAGTGIANWTLDSVTTATNFMLSSKKQEDGFLDLILITWAALIDDTEHPLPANITISFGTNTYTIDAAAAISALENHGWVIQSGGLVQ